MKSKDDLSPFTRFEKLLKGLLRVSKKELDEAQAEYKKQKPHKRGPHPKHA